MGHRRSNGRSAAISFLPGRRNSIGASQTSMTNRMRNSSPTPHHTPVCCSSETSRRMSWVRESNHRSCMLKQERGTFSPHLSLSEQIPSWSENSSSTCSINTFCSTNNASSDSNGSSIHGNNSSKKSERPMSTRPSNPLRYKTELCRSFEENGDCRFGIACTFAHGLSELRAVHRHPLYKTDLCRTYHSLGYCQYGARCHFVHDPEEAAGVSPMRGLKLRSSHDRLGSTLLALAENAGVAPDPSTNNVVLANLRRLYAVRTLQEHSRLPDAPSSRSQLGTSGDIVHSFNPLSRGASFRQSHKVSPMLSAEPSPSKMSVAGSCIGSSVFDTSQDLSLEPSMDVSLDTSVDTGIWSTSSMSTSPSGDSWCGTLSNISPLSPDPESSMKPFLSISSLSLFPMGHEIRGIATQQEVRSVITNPMEMSRSLQLPTIAELCHI